MIENVLTQILVQNSEIANFLRAVNDNSNQTILLVSSDETYLNIIAKLLTVQIESGNLDMENSIYKKVVGESAVDVFYYPKEKQLVVDHANEIVENVYLTPLDFNNKYYIIKNIESATPQAQNKLLKVLEEPPYHAKFILLTTNEGGVLNTIKSRSKKVSLPNLSNQVFNQIVEQEEFGREFKNLTQNQIDLARELSGNTFSEFFDYLKNNKLLDILNLALNLVKDFKTSGQLLEFSSKITALKHDLNLFFTILNFVLADMLLLKTQNMGLVKLKSISQNLLPILNDFSLNAIAKQIQLILGVQKKLHYNTSATSVVDNFLLEFMEVKLLCK